MADIVQCNHVFQRFNKKTILEDINLTARPSEIIGLLGPSGAGKTTLVNVISGMATPVEGEVFVFGEKMPRLDLMGRMGYMSQSDALYLDLTARENLQFFGQLYGLSGQKLANCINEALTIVKLQDDLDKQVEKYSGGMRRRLSLATAMLHKPELLILDEPTVGIDPLLRVEIWQEFNNLKAKGTTILVTTHVMDEAEKCDRLGMIREGRLIALGSPEELKQAAQAKSLEEAFLYFAGGEFHENVSSSN